MPEISVLMSVYNCEEYISDTIKSILNQTFKDFELIIVDDGSIDRSVDVIKRFNDNRVKLFSLKHNQGIPKALNFGMTKCSGKYIAKADADDIYRIDRFEKQKRILDEQPNISVVGSQIEHFPHDEVVRFSERYKNKKIYFEKQVNSIVSSEDIREKLYMFFCLIHSVMMIRKDLLKCFKYDVVYSSLAEDYKLLYELNKKGYSMINVNEKLGQIRVRNESTSVVRKKDLFKAFFNIKREEVVKLFDSPVYIWGAGGYGLGMKKELENNGYKISGFIDKSESKIGTEVEGLTIYSPSFLLENNVKVISASDPGRFEIVDFLKNIGYVHLKDFVVF